MKIFALLLSSFLLQAQDQSPVPITSLPAVTGSLSLNDVIPIVHAAATRKVTLSQLQSTFNRFCLGDTFCNGTANRVLYLNGSKKLITDESFKRYGMDSMLIATSANGTNYSIEFADYFLQHKAKSANSAAFSTLTLDSNQVALSYSNQTADTVCNVVVGRHNAVNRFGITFTTFLGDYTFPMTDGANGEALLSDGAGQLYWGPPASAIKTTNGLYTSNDSLFLGGDTKGYVSFNLDTVGYVDWQNGLGNTVGIGRINGSDAGGFWSLQVVDTFFAAAKDLAAIMFANDGSFSITSNNSLSGNAESVKLRANQLLGTIDTLSFIDMWNGDTWFKYEAGAIKTQIGDVGYVANGTKLIVDDNDASISNIVGDRFARWKTVSDTLHIQSDGPIIIDSLVLPNAGEVTFRANFYINTGDTAFVLNVFENNTGEAFAVYHVDYLNQGQAVLVCTSNAAFFNNKNKVYVQYTHGGDETEPQRSHATLQSDGVFIRSEDFLGNLNDQWSNKPSWIEVRKYP